MCSNVAMLGSAVLFGPLFFPHSFLESGLFVFGFGIGCKKSPCLLKEVVLALKLT